MKYLVVFVLLAALSGMGSAGSTCHCNHYDIVCKPNWTWCYTDKGACSDSIQNSHGKYWSYEACKKAPIPTPVCEPDTVATKTCICSLTNCGVGEMCENGKCKLTVPESIKVRSSGGATRAQSKRMGVYELQDKKHNNFPVWKKISDDGPQYLRVDGYKTWSIGPDLNTNVIGIYNKKDSPTPVSPLTLTDGWYYHDGRWKIDNTIRIEAVKPVKGNFKKMKDGTFCTHEVKNDPEGKYPKIFGHTQKGDPEKKYPYWQRITTEEACISAAGALGLTWGGSWEGQKDFPACLHANDGRNKVYFNKSHRPSSYPNNRKYAEICKQLDVIWTRPGRYKHDCYSGCPRAKNGGDGFCGMWNGSKCGASGFCCRKGWGDCTHSKEGCCSDGAQAVAVNSHSCIHKGFG